MPMTHDRATDKQLAWRCRRGTKELDLILSDFFNNHYPQLSDAQQRSFARLLECTDPQLAEWLCQDVEPTDRELTSIVKHILSARRG